MPICMFPKTTMAIYYASECHTIYMTSHQEVDRLQMLVDAAYGLIDPHCSNLLSCSHERTFRILAEISYAQYFLHPASKDGTFPLRPSAGAEAGKLLPRSVQGVPFAPLRQSDRHPSWADSILPTTHP